MDRLSTFSLLEVMGELFSEEVSFAVTDTENYIFYRPSKRINLKLRPGDPVRNGTITYKALQTGDKVSEFVNRNILGVPYQGMAVPIYNNGVIEGCVTAIYPALSDLKSVVTIKTQDGWVPIPFQDVLYLEAKNRKTHVITEHQTGTHKDALQEFDFLLPKDSFIRCHRSYIVNVKKIKEIFPDTHSTFVLSMMNGDLIPVSQSYSSYFRKLLGF